MATYSRGWNVSKKPFWKILARGVLHVVAPPLLLLAQRFRTFCFNGRKYHYFHHLYNRTWMNERSVEIPIVHSFIRERLRKGISILEVGNVLSHYFNIRDVVRRSYFGEYVVVDKYEEFPGVVNEDVVDFLRNRPNAKYDLVVSVSTLEHVGFDEQPRELNKSIDAYNLMLRSLKARGEMIVTLPLGYNPVIDRAVAGGTLKFTKAWYFLRTGKFTWKQVDSLDISSVRYGEPYPCANAIVVLYFKNDF